MQRMASVRRPLLFDGSSPSSSEDEQEQEQQRQRVRPAKARSNAPAPSGTETGGADGGASGVRMSSSVRAASPLRTGTTSTTASPSSSPSSVLMRAGGALSPKRERRTRVSSLKLSTTAAAVKAADANATELTSTTGGDASGSSDAAKKKDGEEKHKHKRRKSKDGSEPRAPAKVLTEQEAKLEIERRELESKNAAQRTNLANSWRQSVVYRTLAAHCWDRPRMTLADTMLLSPWQKWKKYNRIPWKVVLHALIFLVVTIQVLLAYVETSQYTRATHNTFENLFLTEGTDPDVLGKTMHTMDEVLESLKNTVEKYYEINTKALDMFMQRHMDRDSLGDIRPIQLSYSIYNHNFFKFNNDTWDIQADDLSRTDATVNLTLDNPYGPFNTSNTEEMQDLFQRLVRMSVSFNFINLNLGVLGPIPFMWDVMLLYKKTGGEIRLDLLLDKQIYYTTSIGLETQNIFTIFNVLVFVLAMISFLYSVRSFFTNIVVFLRTKRTYLAIPKKVMKEENYPAWSRIPFSVKFEFFSLWTIHNLVTSSFLMVASILGLVEEFGFKTGMAYSIFEGMGALGASITIIRYLEYYEHFYTLILTLKISALRIARFIISAFPIYFGYMLMGVVLFSPYSIRFMDLNMTAITLFALLNGDEIRAAFEQLVENYPYPIVPTVYLYTFIALFITAILNIFIFIIEDSYHAAKFSRRSQTKSGPGVNTAANAAHMHGPGGHGHGQPIHGGENRPRDKSGSDFDIFALFRILDREYNVVDDDDDNEMTIMNSDSDSDSDSDDSSESEAKKSKKKKQKKKAGKSTTHTTSEDEPSESDSAASLAAASFSINATGDDVARLLRSSLNTAGHAVTSSARSDNIPLLSARPRITSRDFRELGYARPSDTPRSFDYRITLKKLKRDLNEIMADQMAEFEEELAITLADLQVKHTALLQKRVKGQLQKSLEHLNPTSISSSDWRPGFSEYRESPF